MSLSVVLRKKARDEFDAAIDWYERRESLSVGAIAPVPWIPVKFARFSTRERLEILMRSGGAVATGECQIPITKDT